MSDAMPRPIIAKAVPGRRTPIVNAGVASKKPTKNRMAAGRMYDVLMMFVENWIVHGTVRNQTYTSHRGSAGSTRETYHARKHSAANESRFSRTVGDSGAATM